MNVHDATFETLDLRRYEEDDRYKFLTATVVPRPIALVTSLGSNGVLNAAPFSQFVIISITPPLLGFVAHDASAGGSFASSPGQYKDTVRNVLEQGEFVINAVSEHMALQVQQCSHPYPAEVSEVTEVGFHAIPSQLVAPSRVAESRIHFECKLHRTVQFGEAESRTTLVVGEVVLVHCLSGVRSRHRVEHAKLEPLGRIAGRSYCRTTDVIQV